jgi:hypothetical protein
MTWSVGEAVKLLEGQDALRHRKQNDAESVIARVSELLGCPLPPILVEFYRHSVYSVGEFLAVSPEMNGRAGWRQTKDDAIRRLLDVDAVPVFYDGSGNLFGLDLKPTNTPPAVYFFDHEQSYERPVYAAGSSLGVFLLLLSRESEAYAEDWPADWQHAIDPDIDKCPRAPPLWLAEF